jgi:hypothetical protein
VKIKILVPVAGNDFSWYPGQIVELEQAEAEKWADGFRAVPVVEPAQDKAEKRILKAPEKR